MIVVEIIAFAIICAQMVIMTNNRQNKADSEQQHTFKSKTRFMMAIVQFLALFVIIIALPMNLFKVGLVEVPLLVNILGVLLMSLGLLIRILSMRMLGKYYSTLLFVNGDHPLIKDGIYEIVRHPIYLGDLILYCAAGIAVTNFIAFIIVTFTCIPAYLIRIKNEEAMMVESFGDAYIEYSKNTKRLIPFIY